MLASDLMGQLEALIAKEGDKEAIVMIEGNYCHITSVIIDHTANAVVIEGE